MKKILSALICSSMLVSFSTSAFAATSAAVTKGVNFRAGPSTSSTVYSFLQVGTKLEILEKVNPYWLKVSVNGKVGYVSPNFVAEIQPSTPAAAPLPSPSIAANIEKPTNGTVTITITYPTGAAVQQFRIDNGAWTSYSAPITITKNATIEAKAANSAGSTSAVSTYIVSNIDTVAPAAPTLEADKTSTTNSDVLVTINFAQDSAVKEYRVNGGTWTAYTAPVLMTGNGTVEARGTDLAGNVSASGVYNVTNIDKRTFGEKVVDTAMTFQGKVTYKFGTRDIPNLIFDCSSFTQYVFKLNGQSIPWGSKLQANVGTYVPKNQLQVGDLVFLSVGVPGQIDHVGIYVGNELFINNVPNHGVIISDLNSTYWQSRYITARRVSG